MVVVVKNVVAELVMEVYGGGNVVMEVDWAVVREVKGGACGGNGSRGGGKGGGEMKKVVAEVEQMRLSQQRVVLDVENCCWR